MAWQHGIRHGMAVFNPPYHQQLGRPVGYPPYHLHGLPWFAGMRLRHWYTRLVYPQQCRANKHLNCHVVKQLEPYMCVSGF
jgi:hypothetical protein